MIEFLLIVIILILLFGTEAVFALIRFGAIAAVTLVGLLFLVVLVLT